MTVNTASPYVVYTGDGTSVSFAIPFYFLENADITVTGTDTDTGVSTVYTQDVDYTLSGAGVETGGTALFNVAPVAGLQVLINREVSIEQQTQYTPNDKFPAAVTEQAFDRLTMIAQQLDEAQSRSLTVPITAVNVSAELPAPEAGMGIGWNDDATALVNIDAPAQAQASADAAAASASAAAQSAAEAGQSATALNAMVEQLEGSILEFNTFDLGYLDGGEPSGTSIDLGTLA